MSVIPGPRPDDRERSLNLVWAVPLALLIVVPLLWIVGRPHRLPGDKT